MLTYIFILLNLWNISHASLSSHWKEKSVFFGVNKAWESDRYETALVTLVARERYRPFKNADFPEESYTHQLTELRKIGLGPIGIKNWKVKSLDIEKLSDQKILVKIQGTYERKNSLIHFQEWQVFNDYLYQQVNLVQESEASKKISKEEAESLFKGVLEL